MSNYRNPYLKDNEKRYNFIPHLKFKKVKQSPRTKIRQLLRSMIPLYKPQGETGTKMPGACIDAPDHHQCDQDRIDRLEKKREESDCSTIGEVACKILSNKSIKCFTKTSP